MTTLMKLVNSATKFRHGIDKFYQPNSGLRGSKTWDEATYTYMYIYTYIIIYVYVCLISLFLCFMQFTGSLNQCFISGLWAEHQLDL